MINEFLKILELHGLSWAIVFFLCWACWKLITNHIHHIAEDIKDIKNSIKPLVERIATIEGRCSAKTCVAKRKTKKV